MSEETIVEKSAIDMIVEAITSVSAYTLVFVIIFVITALLLAFNKIDSMGFLTGMFGGAIIAILFKYMKKQEK